MGSRRASQGRPAGTRNPHPGDRGVPLAKKGTVDHTQYDTGSILRLITRRFDLEPLPGIQLRDRASRSTREFPMGDLTNALDLANH